MMLVDSHSHIDVSEFDADRVEVIARARSAGVTRQIVPAIEAATWPALRDVCTQSDGLFPAYGLHPVYLDRHDDAHVDALRHWIESERPVAIGECGLDYFIDGLDRDRQRSLFDAHLRLARDFDLPLVVHARHAVDDVISAVRRIGGLRGVVHSFSGSRQQAEMLWANGFLLGLGGPVTYERANRLRTLAATMPIDHLLLETDSPDQPGAAQRGGRNEPARLLDVLETIASLRNQPPGDIAAATTANAERLFRLTPQAPPSS
ncbi:TatD family hydrolase [Lysobacter claricitrinus]|uniref:TatD family hydrolase n=1 Tax=Lysobacter claricitrinus TaxID=3367728 RepID=UPI0037DA9BFA